jgi:hypothetical protein
MVLSEPLYSGSISLSWRPLGTSAFTVVPLLRYAANRAVFTISTPSPPSSFEYKLATTDGALVWPAADVLQTVSVV